MRHRAGIAVTASVGIAVAGLAAAPAVAKTKVASNKGLRGYVASELVASGSKPNGNLGNVIAMSGRTVVVDAEEATVGGAEGAGAVYVYTRSASGKGKLTARAVLTVPGEVANQRVGSVAIDGNTIVIGAGEQAGGGAAYVFQKPAAGWRTSSVPTATLTDPAATNAEIGTSVAISGATIVVGAPYQPSGTTSQAGMVLVYTRHGSRWADSTSPVTLTATSPQQFDDLGFSVAIDGATIVAGAEGREVDGKAGAGAADVFVRPKSGWVNRVESRQLDPKPATTYEYFGETVAVSGRDVVVSAPGYAEGTSYSPPAVFEFNEPHAGWGTHTKPSLRPNAELGRSGGGRYDEFGRSIAISGSVIAIGAPDASIDDEYQSGAVYLYDQPKHGWHNAKQSRQFVAANTERYDSFGSAVAIDGTAIAVGADDADYTGAHNVDSGGAAYVFSRPKRSRRHHVEVAR
jgi:hypothetical protein